MNAHTNIVADAQALAVNKMREPFPPNQISKLPKETRTQSDQRKSKTQGCMVWKCPECGGSHHKDAVHLDYVGHAALTDRLLETDIAWSWEPLAFTAEGLPALDRTGGLWIKLTVCGVTRLGYGAADGKSGGDAIKEIIGDALRNAAMRFGAALDLWHKGDLHADDGAETAEAPADEAMEVADDLTPAGGWGDWATLLIETIDASPSNKALDKLKANEKQRINAAKKEDATMYKAIGDAFTARRRVLDDEIPY